MQALVIDDHLQVRHFVSVILRAEGWQVSEAETVENAFERMHRERERARWDLVFCGVMPGDGVDGLDVLRRLSEEQPEAQVVLMTGRVSAEGTLDATSCGAYDYLLEPFTVGNVRELS